MSSAEGSQPAHDSEPPVRTGTDTVVPTRLSRLPRVTARAIALLYAADRRSLICLLSAMAASGLAVGPRLLGVRDLLTVMMDGQRAGQFSAYVAPLSLIVVSTIVVQTASSVRPHWERLLDAQASRLTQTTVLDAAGGVEFVQFDDPDFHDRLQRAERGALLYPIQVVQGITSLINATLAVAALAVAVILSSPLIAGILAIAYLPVILAHIHNGAAYYSVNYRLTQGDRFRSYLARLLTTRATAAELRFNGAGEYVRARFDTMWHERVRELRSAVRARLRVTARTTILASLLTSAGGVLLVWLLASRRIDLAAVGVLAVASWELGLQLSAIGWAVGNLLESAMFLDDYATFVRRRPQIAAPPAPLPPAAVVAMHDVSFRYQSAPEDVLRNVCLEVRRGELVALVGPSGAGKSTVVKLICGLYRPTRGRVMWSGIDIATVPLDEVRSRVALMFQDFGRYALTAAENIGLSHHRRISDHQGIENVARLAGIHGTIDALPEKYDSLLGVEFQGGTDLSVGQWQRIALARTLFANADLIVLDEPTSALDPETERNFITGLRHACRDKAVLVISHRFVTVKDVDRIYVLDNGAVAQCGRHQDLLSTPGPYARMYADEATRPAVP